MQAASHSNTPVPEYRLYFLDSRGRIRSAQTIEAMDDERALAQAAQAQDHGARELWQRARRVAVLNASAQTA